MLRKWLQPHRIIDLCATGSNKGGDLGEFKRGQMVKEFDDVVFGGQPGILYGPVKTHFGYHLITIKSLS